MNRLRAMGMEDLDAVTRIESEVHAYPWTRGDFKDALSNGWICMVQELQDQVAGYFVLLPGVEEAELLDLAVALPFQRQGWGRVLLHAAGEAARACQARRLLLEVRRSNLAAQALYKSSGFEQIAIRHQYYPVAGGREDALILECAL